MLTGLEDGCVMLSENTGCSYVSSLLNMYQFTFVCAEKTSGTFIRIQGKPRPQNRTVDCAQGGGGRGMGGCSSPSFTGERGR